jgi:hypothetical protein
MHLSSNSFYPVAPLSSMVVRDSYHKHATLCSRCAPQEWDDRASLLAYEIENEPLARYAVPRED